MKKNILLLLTVLFSISCYSQKIKRLEIYTYESQLGDSISHDTVLFKTEHFDPNGFKYKETTYSDSMIIHEEQFYGDSILIVFLHDPKINPEDRI